MEGNQSAKTIKDMLINIAIGNADKADKDLKDFDKSLRTVRGSAHAAERSVNNLLAAFGAGYTIDLTVSKFLDLNKTMLLTGTTFRKYGMGIVKTKKFVKELGDEVGMTQKDIMSFMSSFESSMPIVNLRSMEKIFRNIRSITGNNIDAMQQYAQTFAGIAQKAPAIQHMLENLTDSEGRLNQKSAQRLRNYNLMLISTGQISLQEAKAVQNQISGLKQRSMLEEKNFQRQKKATEAQERFKAFYEELSIVVGETLLPVMTSISDLLKNNSFYIKDIIKAAAKAAAILGPIFLGAKVGAASFSLIGNVLGKVKGGIDLFRGKKGIGGRTEGYESPGGLMGGLKDLMGGKRGYSKGQPLYVEDVNSSFSGEGKRLLMRSVAGRSRGKGLRAPRSSLGRMAPRLAKTGKIGAFIAPLLLKMDQFVGSVKMLLPGSLGGMTRASGGLRVGRAAAAARGAGTVATGTVAARGGGNIAKMLLKGLKVAGPSLALLIGEIIAKHISGRQREQGNLKAAGATGMAGNAMGVGGMALAGATIGSFGGPPGVVIGAVLGTIIGTVMELESFGQNFADVVGNNAISDSITGAFAELRELPGTIKEAFVAGWNWVTETISGWFNSIVDWIANTTVGKWISDAYNAVSDFISTAKEAVVTFTEEWWKGFNDLLYDTIPAASVGREIREAREAWIESELAWLEQMRQMAEDVPNRINERNQTLVSDTLVNELAAQTGATVDSQAGFNSAESNLMNRMMRGDSMSDILDETGNEILTSDERVAAQMRAAETAASLDLTGDNIGGLDAAAIREYVEENGPLTEDKMRELAAAGQFGITDFQETTGMNDQGVLRAINAIGASSDDMEAYTSAEVGGGDLSEAQENALALRRSIQGIIAESNEQVSVEEKIEQIQTQLLELANRRRQIVQATTGAYSAQAQKLQTIAGVAAEIGNEAAEALGFGSVDENVDEANRRLRGQEAAARTLISASRGTVNIQRTQAIEEAEEVVDREMPGLTGEERTQAIEDRANAALLENDAYQQALKDIAEQEGNIANQINERIKNIQAVTAVSERELQVQQQFTAALQERVNSTSNLLQLTGDITDGLLVEDAARDKIAQNASEVEAIDARIASERDMINRLQEEGLANSQTIAESEARILAWQNQQVNLRADNIRQLQAVLQYYDAFVQSQARLASSTKELLDSTVELSVMTSGLVDQGEVQNLMGQELAATRQTISDIDESLVQKNRVLAELAQSHGTTSTVYRDLQAEINSLAAQRNQAELSILQTYFAQARAAEQIRSIQEGYLNAQEGLYQSQLEYAALTGNINIDDLVDQYGTVRESIEGQRELIRNAITEQEQALANALADTNASESFRLQQQTRLLELQQQELSLTQRMQSAITDISKAYELRRRSTQLESEYLQGMVQLQDNLTVGIGASAAMRMESFAAIGQEIAVMKEEQEALQRMLSEGNIPLEQQVQVENRLKELRNEQLSALQKQNDLVKSLRDGWVSAMTAATNGQGKITKIMVSQEGNLAALQDRFSGIRSSMSGATLRAGERSIGAQMSQQFTANGGGIPGTAGISGGTGIGYMSDVDRWLGLDPAALSQQMLGGMRSQVVNQFQGAIQQGIGAGQSLGLGGQNQQLLNAPGQGGGAAPFTPPGTGGQGGGTGGGTSTRRTQGGIVINCTFNVNTLSEAVTELSRRIRELQQQHTDLSDSLMPDGGAGNGSR